MAASTSPLDKFRHGASNISTTLQASISISDTSLTPASVANIPTITAVDISIDRVDSSGVATPSKWERCIGYVSGGNIVGLLRAQDGSTAVAHSTGAVIEMMPTGKWSQDLVNGLLVSHNQDGTLLTSAVQSALGLSNLNGYTPVGYAPNTVTYNGNRSYTCVFNSVDLTSFLSPGIRLRTTRTVAAPTQSTSLNGTNQYYSKASPAGMTFTDDFVVSAWIKLTSYPTAGAGAIIGRSTAGTTMSDGWALFITNTGLVQLIARNGGSGNYSAVNSVQSIPLNKWVHIAAQLDMSTFTASTTTSYVMIDGVDVPAAVSRAGTNPTTLTNTGDLTIGRGTATDAYYFPGKIAQAAVFSSKVTQSTIQSYISQGLVGTETTLISAYSFNNSINDLNTTNANNLTANGSAVATNSDSPFGGQGNSTISSTLDYGIVQSATFSTNTTLILQVPEGCTIPTSGGVSSVVYSSNSVPYLFPKQKDKWKIQSFYKTLLTQSATVVGTWYNLNTVLNVPVGDWMLGYTSSFGGDRSAAGDIQSQMTLSDANNTQLDQKWTTYVEANPVTGSFGAATVSEGATVTTQAPRYLNMRAFAAGALTLYVRGDQAITVITAENAWI